MSRKSWPDAPLRLPIELRSVSNGEFEPTPPSAELLAFERRVFERAFEYAKRSGVSRRRFLSSSAGAACVLLSMNELGCGGGRYALPENAPVDPPQADAALEGEEFVFDVQTHRVSTTRASTSSRARRACFFTPSCSRISAPWRPSSSAWSASRRTFRSRLGSFTQSGARTGKATSSTIPRPASA